MKETLLLLGNLLVHPVKTVKTGDLLNYRDSLLYVLGFLFVCVYLYLNLNPNLGPVAYVSVLLSAIPAFIFQILFEPLYYFVILKLAKADLTYQIARWIYLPLIIVRTFCTVIYNIGLLWIPFQILYPVFSILGTLWFAALTFLFCKYKFKLPERRCRSVFIIIILIEIVRLIIYFALFYQS